MKKKRRKVCDRCGEKWVPSPEDKERCNSCFQPNIDASWPIDEESLPDGVCE